MPDEIIVKKCSPTLAGLKTANLFPVNGSSSQEVKNAVCNLNRRLSNKGLRVLPFKYGEGKALLYLYRPEKLKKDLQNSDAADLLTEMGYTVSSPERCLATLIKKMNCSEQFPHEVGLFLGYPPEDVKGFIYHKDEGCKCVGCWKVYGDESKAKETFCKYENCTNLYCKQWKKGKSIEQLAVAI